MHERTEPRWTERLSSIDTEDLDIQFPDVGEKSIPQDAEWCQVVVNGQTRRVRFHDYGEIYRVPGFYEILFYDMLECCSPTRVCRLLEDVLMDCDDQLSDLSVLDVGAGNGMVGDELVHRGVCNVVGIDIVEEARQAALRDRPEVYDDYIVADLTDLPEDTEKKLRRTRFNCLSTVAALGFGDIPPKAFLKALDLLDTPAWLAFNIKEEFLRNEWSGFAGLIQQLASRQIIQVQAYRRYQHRLSIKGDPLYYVAVIARKLQDIPDHLMEST